MKRLCCLTLLLAAVLCGAAAQADPAGEKVMRIMDASFTRAQDQYFEYEVITTQPGKSPARLTMKTWVKGQHRLIEYTSPGDIKGMKALVVSLDELYVYLPAFRKVRRVAAHAREQSYMGTALSQDDTSISVYDEVYQGKLVGETRTHWKIQSYLRPGKKHPYPRIDFEISKKYEQPTHIDYYGDKGVKVKSEDRLEYGCQGNICNARRMIVTDHTRNNLRTELIRNTWKVNNGLPDSLFTPRSLQRGP
jgi:outer membrane lipoprotein-sorting protein